RPERFPRPGTRRNRVDRDQGCRLVPGDVLLAPRLLTSGRGRATFVSWHPPGSVVAPGRSARSPRVARVGKPMPAAGKTAHVRRLLVDRSRCGLEVSPAPPGDRMSPGQGEGQ